MHALAWANQGCSKATLLKRAEEWKISLGKEQQWTYEQYKDILEKYDECQNNLEFDLSKVRKLVDKIKAEKTGTNVKGPKDEEELDTLQYLFDNIRLTEKLKCKIKAIVLSP